MEVSHPCVILYSIAEIGCNQVPCGQTADTSVRNRGCVQAHVRGVFPCGVNTESPVELFSTRSGVRCQRLQEHEIEIVVGVTLFPEATI